MRNEALDIDSTACRNHGSRPERLLKSWRAFVLPTLLLGALLHPGTASATLIGDTIDITVGTLPTVANVTVVPGNELSGYDILPLVTCAGAGAVCTVSLDLNLSDGSYSFSYNYSTNGSVSTLTIPRFDILLDDLDWIGEPNRIIDGCAPIGSTNCAFGAHSLTVSQAPTAIIIGPNANQTLSIASGTFTTTLAVPEPVTTLLLGLGLVALGASRRGG